MRCAYIATRGFSRRLSLTRSLVSFFAVSATLVACSTGTDGTTARSSNGGVTDLDGGEGGASGYAGAGLGGTAGTGGLGQGGASQGGSSGGQGGTGGQGQHVGCPKLGDSQCAGNKVQVCAHDGSGGRDWQTTQFCSIDTEECKVIGGKAQCVAAPTCHDKKKNQDETGVDCGGAHCGPCGAGQPCKANSDCESGLCTPQGVCSVCKPNAFGCYGNFLQKCSSDGAGWTQVAHCRSGQQICNPAAGACQAPKVVGGTKPTGVYYQYAEFCTRNSSFKGGFDLGALGNELFVNRDGAHIDVYRVEIEDSDGDGKVEPNQHPQNPKANGPMEKRKLVFERTYNVPVSNEGGKSVCGGGRIASNEIQPFSSSGGNADLYFISQWSGRLGIAHWQSSNPSVQLVAPWNLSFGCDEVLGYDPQIKTWYIGVYQRRVYSWHAPTKEWVLEFVYPNLAGAHMDGLEVVVDPKTNIPYLYVSDMTSDFIAQYHKTKAGVWEQTNLFRYNRGKGDYIEGMGFGPLNHFWMSAVVDPYHFHDTNCIYEIGGGDLAKYVEPN